MKKKKKGNSPAKSDSLTMKIGLLGYLPWAVSSLDLNVESMKCMPHATVAENQSSQGSNGSLQ